MTIKDFQEDQVVYEVTFYPQTRHVMIDETTVNSIWRKYLMVNSSELQFMRAKEDNGPYLVEKDFYKHEDYFDGMPVVKWMLFADKSVADKFIREFETHGTIDGDKHYKTLSEHWTDADPGVERMYITARSTNTTDYVGLIEKKEALRLYGDWRYDGGYRFGDDAEHTWLREP